MSNSLIRYDLPPVKEVLNILVIDRTSNKKIIFATNEYETKIAGITKHSEITVELLDIYNAPLIQPRITKTLALQAERTRKKAEVFSPSWLCNYMNNHCDQQWFGKPNVFNQPVGHNWITNYSPIIFSDTNGWENYVQSLRLEVACGEAPYLASRYDTTTGEIIPVIDRVGILDRKLRIVSENTRNQRTWFTWAKKAFQSVYGYEFQGDNLLIARINLLLTFVDSYKHRWNSEPSTSQLEQIATIISWNLWQMDAQTGLRPFEEPKCQFTLFNNDLTLYNKKECILKDWKENTTITFNELKSKNEI